MPSSRGSSQPRDQTQVSHIAGRFFTTEPPEKPKNTGVGSLVPSPELSDPGIEPGSPALQADSLPAELPEKPKCCSQFSSVAQSCLTLCNPINRGAWWATVHGDSPGKNTGVGCHALLQGIFPTTGLNPGLPHCRRTLYWVS